MVLTVWLSLILVLMDTNGVGMLVLLSQQHQQIQRHHSAQLVRLGTATLVLLQLLSAQQVIHTILPLDLVLFPHQLARQVRPGLAPPALQSSPTVPLVSPGHPPPTLAFKTPQHAPQAPHGMQPKTNVLQQVP